MCRVLLYLGEESVPIYDLIYGSDNSLTHQSYAPKLMSHIQNLAGLGFCAWSKNSDNPKLPFYYKTTQLPFFDKNLYRLSKKINTNCLLAHVRGVEYSPNETVSEQNVHPFKLDSTSLALAHNGSLSNMPEMKRWLTPLIKPDIYAHIKGTTDSEWIYALFLSMLDDYKSNVSMDEARTALISALSIIRNFREQNGITEASPVNLFVTNGTFLIITRFVYNFGCYTHQSHKAFLEYHSLWATFGGKYEQCGETYKMRISEKRNNIIFASEPLTTDSTTWIEMPEYSITSAWLENHEVMFKTEDLTV